MPLHGKIVVIKRTGGDGTEFPLTATCLFGRKPDCDIRIQLPQVSKEHCRIDLNENKEVILTNLSSVNPTRVNGEALQQSERLKHGDVITVIDRSFRFEYPPAPTPKKKSSTGGKTETLKVFQDQQVGDTVTTEKGERRISEVSTDPHLKDGANHGNIQRSLEKPLAVESKEDVSLLQSKAPSPFNDLYQMIKKSLDVKTPRKSSASLLQTPASRFCTPRPGSVRKNDGKPVVSTGDKSNPKKDEAEVSLGADESMVEPINMSNEAPKCVKKQRKSFQVPSTEETRPEVEEAENTAKSAATSPQMRNRATPQRFTVGEVIEQVSAQTPKSPVRRRSKEAKPAVNNEQGEQAVASPKTDGLRRVSPRNSGKVEKVKETSQKRKSGELAATSPRMKRKRVSFGGYLCPELFDKRLPPDSPLCKGATPRRSLCLPKPKPSLLRRASVIGLLQEFEQEHPDSPKVQSPAKKRTPSPKKSSAKNASPSPASGKSPSRKQVETPKATGQTPTVQGRFSVSRISTPSPVAVEAVADQLPSVTVTPKLSLRRKSMKSTSRKTPNMASAAKVMRRRSGISRASMKVINSWADIVKFGQAKAQVAAPAQTVVTKKRMKKAVPKPQTPARVLKGHFSTGHANSPVTIVLGRAHKQKVVQPTGAAPRLVTNTVVPKKNMKMDEDLTGVSEMFKTPVNERKRRSVTNENSAMKTPVGGLSASVVEPSVLNTPEEPGEMMVSPLSVSSTVKDGRYSSEAVQRFLDGEQESSFISDVPAMETHSDSNEQPCTDLKTTTVTTPKQKPELPECLTGVKRIMKTPRQKAEPVEDLRGRLLKTPKQKPEQQECLTGVKRIMKTPRQKTEPIEDIRGKLLSTPKQKPEQQECLTGVKRIFKTPQKVAEPLEDLQGKCLETPKPLEAGDASLEAVKELVATPANLKESEDLSEMTHMKTPGVNSSPAICLTGIKRIMKTPKERSAPVEDMVGVKSLMETPREESESVEENFGIKILVKSPRLLMEEPLTDLTGQLETNEVEDQTCLDCGVDVAKELDFAREEPQYHVPSDVIDNVPQTDMEKAVLVDEHLEEVPSGHDDNNKLSDAMETISEVAVDENVSEEQPKVESATDKVSEMDTTATDPDHEKKSVRGRRAKTVESKPAKNKMEATENSEDPAISAPVRGRRGKKTEAIAPPAVRQTTRSRNAKTTESRDVELPMEKSVSLPSKVPPKRGRNAKKASDDQAEIVHEAATGTEIVPEPESEQSPPVDVNHEANDSAAPLEKAVLKPRRGRKTKQPEQSMAEQQDVPCTHSDDVPQADTVKGADANEICSDQLEAMPNGSDANESSESMETVSQTPVTESLPEVETATSKATEMDAPIVQKKSVRGRRAKVVESEPAEDKQEATEHSEDAVVPAPVRGRRGKKTEATAPPAVKQRTRGRNAKPQQSTSDDQPEMLPEKAVEATQVTEISTEAVTDQTSPVNTHQEEKDSAPPAEEAVVKPVRGRKTKQTPVEPPQPVRAKRGRNAKQEEEKLENNGETTSVETTKSQETVKQIKRTRKAEQNHVEPREEVQTVEMIVPEDAEAPLVVEPLKMSEQATVTAKPRRGGRKAKQDAESETPVETTEVQEVPSVSSTDKSKRGKRGKPVSEEVVSAVVPEEKPHHELEAEKKNNVEQDTPVIKPVRARGVKTSLKNEVSQAIPAKRVRRGAALPVEETKAKSTALVAETPKRGRRAATKPTAEDATVASDQANPTEDLSNDVAEDTKKSKRSVKWTSDLDVSEIPKVTQGKAVRGRKSKLGDQVDTESKNVSTDANKAEEEDLSEKVVEAQPVKRARRVAKVADVTADESTSKVKSVESETQPKTRRGRSAKK